MRATALARTSSFTGRETQPDSRSCPSVAGRDVIGRNPTLHAVQRSPALGWVIALLLACDLVVVGVRTFGAQTRVTVRVHVPPTQTVTVLPPGQAKVTGHLDSLGADAQNVGLVPTPFTIEVPDRGNGGATIEEAVVDGRRSTIEWDAGRPLPITGGPGGGLDVGAVHLDVDAGGSAVQLDGDVRNFAPGQYTT